MWFHLKVVFICISFMVCIEYILCDDVRDGTNTQKLACVCAATPVGANHHLSSNCSTSCHCTPDVSIGGANEEGWACQCSPKLIPEEPSIHDVSCFSSCNCTSGLSNMSSAKKNVSSKPIIIVLLLCVLLTTMAFVISTVCYFYRKDRYHMQSQISSNGDSSWSSATNLINHQTSLFSECRHSNSITGFFWKASIIFQRKRQMSFSCIIQFSYTQLELATDKFSKDNLIGIGGSSNVYRGQLKDGKVVAIKKLKTVGGSDVDSEFLTEIELLSRLNHRHVVPLLGYCIEYQGKQYERLLVFEYMSNGDLRDCLDTQKGKDPLDWKTRVRIALGVARGVEYLHEAAAPRILHRDIKSTNVLLDDKYTAKLTDLGMAKRLITDDLASCTSSPARMLGTFGYFAPEYAIVGKASLKSDVFSFGVVMLELITGRQAILKFANKGDESLVIWASPKLHSSKLVISELPDPHLKGNFPEEEMQMMAHLIRECLHWDPESRPSMSEVVQILSAIASDRAKRRNLPAKSLSGPQLSSTKSSSGSQRCQDLNQVAMEKMGPDQFIPEKSSIWSSFSWSDDQCLCDNYKENDGIVLSAGYMDGIMHHMPNAPSSSAQDDEVVDLTEPRFELFMQENMQVPCP